jgi:transposase
MPKHLHLTERPSTEEWERRYRQARDPVERSHYQIVWLVAQGRLTREIAAVTGYSPNWIGQLARRYSRLGPQALGDRRQGNVGATPLLSPAQQHDLWQAVQGPAPDGGLWTGPKVAAWIGQRLDRPVREQRGWEYLRKLGFSPQRPRPRHPKADPAAQAAFKESFRASSRLSGGLTRGPRSSCGPRTSIASA